MTTYTHRHKRTRKRCRIVHESKHDGYTVVHVEVEGERGRYLWPLRAFERHHREIARESASAAAAIVLAEGVQP